MTDNKIHFNIINLAKSKTHESLIVLLGSNFAHADVDISSRLVTIQVFNSRGIILNTSSLTHLAGTNTLLKAALDELIRFAYPIKIGLTYETDAKNKIEVVGIDDEMIITQSLDGKFKAIKEALFREHYRLVFEQIVIETLGLPPVGN